VKWFDRDISALETALQETPEILASVRVNLPIRVGLGVVNHLMSKFIKTVIGLERIRVDRRARLHMLANHRVKFWLRPNLDMFGGEPCHRARELRRLSRAVNPSCIPRRTLWRKNYAAF
jgi:hypothetical protein